MSTEEAGLVGDKLFQQVGKLHLQLGNRRCKQQ